MDSLSRPFKFNWSDLFKSVRVFFWHFGSWLLVVAATIVLLPQEQIPEQLLWLVPIASLVNAIAMATKSWAEDNQMK